MFPVHTWLSFVLCMFSASNHTLKDSIMSPTILFPAPILLDLDTNHITALTCSLMGFHVVFKTLAASHVLTHSKAKALHSDWF